MILEGQETKNLVLLTADSLPFYTLNESPMSGPSNLFGSSLWRLMPKHVESAMITKVDRVTSSFLVLSDE